MKKPPIKPPTNPQRYRERRDVVAYLYRRAKEYRDEPELHSLVCELALNIDTGAHLRRQQP